MKDTIPTNKNKKDNQASFLASHGSDFHKRVDFKIRFFPAYFCPLDNSASNSYWVTMALSIPPHPICIYDLPQHSTNWTFLSIYCHMPILPNNTLDLKKMFVSILDSSRYSCFLRSVGRSCCKQNSLDKSTTSSSFKITLNLQKTKTKLI